MKGHGLGNDYLVFEESSLGFSLTPKAIRRICDRHRGVGSDGIVLVGPSRKADFRLRIFNPDGSEAEKSGNGIRIATKVLYDYGRLAGPRVTLETKGGLVRALIQVRNGRAHTTTVDMGQATFTSRAVGLTGAARDTSRVAIRAMGCTFDATCVSMGNPHCVVWVPRVAGVPLHEWGPALERHPWFRHRTNVQFVEVRSRHRVSIKLWERGAGETAASGSSACAVAAACVRRGRTGRRVTVAMPGGALQIQVRPGWQIRMTGPASEVCRGELAQELVDGFS